MYIYIYTYVYTHVHDTVITDLTHTSGSEPRFPHRKLRMGISGGGGGAMVETRRRKVLGPEHGEFLN